MHGESCELGWNVGLPEGCVSPPPLPAPGVGEGREPWSSLRGCPALGSFLQPHGPQAGGSRDRETPAASS